MKFKNFLTHLDDYLESQNKFFITIFSTVPETKFLYNCMAFVLCHADNFKGTKRNNEKIVKILIKNLRRVFINY